jgi:long-chain acyl-CoA synthetase
VLQGYGLTECSPIVTVNRDALFRHDSIGLPITGVKVKLDNVDENGIGELVVQGDIVMLGYYENPIATQKVLTNCCLYTGDLGYIDDEGYIFITGRKKNVIVTKNGKNIFLEEVEAYLAKCQFIKESLVWG